MPGSKQKVFLHLVWGTWNRQPMIIPDIERTVFRLIEDQAVKLGCSVLAINGMPDHIHLVIKMPSTISLADLMKQVKGVSSNAINHKNGFVNRFKWQGGSVNR
ncbi:MAG: IS200/IS605 family transposase [Anaerolineales bacterium]|nr:IS200/IS605 family transposase [Anaerolineales bacterium]